MNKEKLVIMLGSAYLECDEQYIEKRYFKKMPTLSNPQYERKLIKGFLNNDDYDFIFISAPHVGYWPFRTKKLKVKGFHENDYLKTVCYISPFGLLQHFKARAIKRKIKSLLDEKISNYDSVHIICGECQKQYLEGIKYLKSKHSKVFSTVIVPDLPSNIVTYKNFIYRFFKKRNVEQVHKLCDKYADSFLCFTAAINEKININNKPYIIYEGVIDRCKCELKQDTSVKHISYIGKTDNRNGVESILEVAKEFNDEYIFDIYGNGDMDNQLRGQLPSNVKYHGYLSPDKIDDVMSKSDIMVSLRKPIGEYVSLSFPSKIFEYISYDKPIVTFRLPCYFQELDKVLVYPSDYSAVSIKTAILNALKSKDNCHIIYEPLKEKYSPINVARAIVGLN